MRNLFFSVVVLLVLFLGGCGTQDDRRFAPQIEGASFSGTDNAWLTIKWGGVFRTNDRGKSWHYAKPGEDGFVQIYFLDAKRGYAVDIRGGTWRSGDGGETWSRIGKIQPSGETVIGKPQQMHFTDEQNGWIVDSFSVWCTKDGGVNWTRCFSTDKTDLAQPLRSYEVTPQVAWVATTNGKIYRTRDGRQSWEKKSLSRTTDFRDVFFIDESTGWLAGEPNGGIYRTEDGGETWNLVLQQQASNNIGIQSVFFLNKNDGWAAGRSYPADVARQATRGVLLRTADSGRTWQSVTVGEDELFFTRIYFVNAQDGWLVGQMNLYRTADGGKTWSLVLKAPTQ